MFTKSKLTKSVSLAIAFGVASAAMIGPGAAIAQESASPEEKNI